MSNDARRILPIISIAIIARSYLPFYIQPYLQTTQELLHFWYLSVWVLKETTEQSQSPL